MLHHHAFSVQTFSVLLVHRIFSVTQVFKLDESVAGFNDDFSNSAISSEEVLDVTLPETRVLQTPDKDASAHDAQCLLY